MQANQDGNAVGQAGQAQAEQDTSLHTVYTDAYCKGECQTFENDAARGFCSYLPAGDLIGGSKNQTSYMVMKFRKKFRVP